MSSGIELTVTMHAAKDASLRRSFMLARLVFHGLSSKFSIFSKGGGIAGRQTEEGGDCWEVHSLYHCR